MKLSNNLFSNRRKWILFFIFSLNTLFCYSQCITFCKTNAGIYSNNDPKSIAYDNMGSSFHSSYISEKNGFKVWGEQMASNGTGHVLTPALINSANYSGLTGTVYYVGIGSNYAGFVQLIVLTSTGLFASGDPGIVLSTGIKNTTNFSKLTINGKTCLAQT